MIADRRRGRLEAKESPQYRYDVEQFNVRLSHEYPEWGADQIRRLVRHENNGVSNVRIRKVRRQEELLVSPPKKK